jgi:signal transduction histidine kinase
MPSYTIRKKNAPSAQILATLPDAVFLLDTQHRIINANPTALRLFHTRIIGMSFDTLVPAFAQMRGYVRHHMDIVLPVHGQERHYELTSVPYGKHQHQCLVTLHDITHRYLVLKERDEHIKALDSYAHTVAHDLKNPLSVVLGYSDLLQNIMKSDIPPTPEEMALSLEYIRKGTESSIGIVNALLLLANVTNDADIKHEKVDMELTLSMAQQALMHLIEEHQATLHVQALYPCVGFAPWVFEVCMNMISNAIKYGGRPPIVQIGSQFVGNFVRYHVLDNGQGLTADEQKSLFVQFGRLDRHKNIEGHGLGLSIVRRIVRRLGGEVGINSQKGQGAEFYFMLPRCD